MISRNPVLKYAIHSHLPLSSISTSSIAICKSITILWNCLFSSPLQWFNGIYFGKSLKLLWLPTPFLSDLNYQRIYL